MKSKLWTIGYTGFDVGSFMDSLGAEGIESLIDIREIPISRKRGFSKSALRDHLQLLGVNYHHFRELGSPRDYRAELRETGDFSTFFDRVNGHLESPSALDQLAEAIQISRLTRSCLMCCCPDWQHCHRRCVVEAILRTASFSVKHLECATVGKSKTKAA